MIKMKKLNNKGFSLVELIIVIAIMAILVGVVGSQVIPYLENSRKAKDIQVLSSWNTSAMSAYSGAAAIIDPTLDYYLRITDGSTDGTGVNVGTATNPTSTPAGACTSIKNAFMELSGFNVAAFKFGSTGGSFESKAGKDIDWVEVWIKHEGGMQMTIHNATSAKYNFDVIYSK
jgi:prepilin-type N-terminal cleavage/methylation domain-containing protein